MKVKRNPRQLPKKQSEEDNLNGQIQNLPPELAEVLDSIPEDKRSIVLGAMVRYEQRTFTGPLPHPDSFAGYENTLPGAADRILSMAEKEQNHRHEAENEMISAMEKQHTRGQNIGCFLAVILSAIAFILGFLGHDWLSGAVFTTTIVSVIIVYVLERQPKSENIQK